jgi:dihydrofolate synthase / folylpolyglutamate synthase
MSTIASRHAIYPQCTTLTPDFNEQTYFFYRGSRLTAIPPTHTLLVMSFADAVTYLYSLMDYERAPERKAAVRYLNLERMAQLATLAGNPHEALRCAHIAGTKGKGSTAALLASILRAAGRRTGLYTSPHLLTFRERIVVDGVPIPEEAFAAEMDAARPLVEAMRDTPGGPPSFFEVLTLMAFRWFLQQGVEVAVLETGLGGRLDATNIVHPAVTGITTLAFDHREELGDTLAAIAREKAGILKPGVPCISAPQEPEAEAVLATIAGERDCPYYRVGVDITVAPGPYGPRGQRATIQGRLTEYTDVRLPLLGEHQLINAAVAVGMAEVLKETGDPITMAAVDKGLVSVRWPGRMQVLQRKPVLLLDGAHDPASVRALLAALERHLPGRRIHFLAGFSRDKDWPTMLRMLAEASSSLTLVQADSPRAVAPEEVAEVAKSVGVIPTVKDRVGPAIAEALEAAERGDLLCVTGSLYVVGEALAWWQQRSAR